jgi:hypothetical protein
MFTSAHKLTAPSITDATTEGAQLLFIHVICQAVEDHSQSAWHNEVDAFFSGPIFARYCAMLGWNPDWARHRIQGYVARRQERAPSQTRNPAKLNTHVDSRVASKLASR